MSPDLREVDSSQQPREEEAVVVLILHVRKVRLREVQQLARSHTAAEGQSGSHPSGWC